MNGSCWSLDLAGVAVRFESADPEWGRALARRYAAFATAGACAPAAPVIELRTREVPEQGAALVRRLVAERPAIHVNGRRLELRTPSLELELDLDRGGWLEAPRHRAAVDLALRCALPLWLGDGLVFHAAMLRDGDRGWLCAGPSGAGKSTLAALLPNLAVCDELAVARRTAAGWEACSLPYWHAVPARARLAGVHLLRHAPVDRIRPLGAGEGFRRLQREVLWPAVGAAAAAPAFALLASLVAEVPIHELGFRPTAAVEQVIRGRAAA